MGRRAGRSPCRLLRLTVLVSVPVAALSVLCTFGGLPSADLAPGGSVGSVQRGGDKRLQVVILGSSITAYANWPDDLAEQVSACLGRDVDIRRVARPGSGSLWGIASVDRVAVLRPDLVLVELSINDSSVIRGVPLSVSRSQHERLLNALAHRLPGVQIALVTTNPVRGASALVRPGLPEYYQMYRDLARDRGLAVVDVSDSWGAAEPLGADALPDGLHPGTRVQEDIYQATMRDWFCGARS